MGDAGQSVFLVDLPTADPDRNMVDRGGSLAEFIALPSIARLGWPDAVVEDWLFDHGAHEAFQVDYRDLDLSAITWTLEDVPAASLQVIRTGPSEQKFLESVAMHHFHYLGLRPAPIRDGWELKGTWMTAPLLLELKLLNRDEVGLRLVEGRMRIGILQGRLHTGFHVASTHKAWVGRGRADAS
ncbi:hypothetical protein QMG83_15245 [Salinibacterium sp. G-O1]|uniref:hypothetical protein n=1 Tax=Salinibacterium sp. G-O1 TaxID=3046208 RepID=UPI0024BB0BB6|nr:hypothetical protein [Salinibacterium sp. G-O1]MDJ0336583.1 hypothetical protein [Salinibacterium sp. G-O1]